MTIAIIIVLAVAAAFGADYLMQYVAEKATPEETKAAASEATEETKRAEVKQEMAAKENATNSPNNVVDILNKL